MREMGRGGGVLLGKGWGGGWPCGLKHMGSATFEYKAALGTVVDRRRIQRAAVPKWGREVG